VTTRKDSSHMVRPLKSAGNGAEIEANGRFPVVSRAVKAEPRQTAPNRAEPWRSPQNRAGSGSRRVFKRPFSTDMRHWTPPKEDAFD